MAVLVEGVSVVIRCDSIVKKYAGGVQAFTENLPNNSLCADGALARMGFMTPADARAFVELLAIGGLKYREGDEALDLVVVDQRSGFLVPCDWARFGSVTWEGSETKVISVCWAGTAGVGEVVVPEGWNYENSLSAHHEYVDIQASNDNLIFIRHEQGVDVFLDKSTGKDYYVAR